MYSLFSPFDKHKIFCNRLGFVVIFPKKNSFGHLIPRHVDSVVTQVQILYNFIQMWRFLKRPFYVFSSF